ncbi:hypothetical protein JT31_01970 [Cedecea neteri]|uniref:Uncharacterized protein n=1 Tax=Cedecea neteri TaxID=158822 RepID=A0A089PTW5_9ENTR|nr:hypothetical protein [Cedecea neteri]AIR03428.1 hypothetical protein JT31_01970 [Cedecea neteri]
MGRVKDWALNNELREREISFLRAEASYELEQLKNGLPKTVNECHEMITNLASKNAELFEMLSDLNKASEKNNSFWSKVRSQTLGFVLGIIASIIAGFF